MSSISLLNNDPRSWLILEELAPTNTFLLESNFPSGTVCLAQHQTAGKGSHGRQWFDLPKQSFLFSGLLRMKALLYSQQSKTTNLNLLPLLTGAATLIALQKFIRKFQPKKKSVSLQIKWPNDIYQVIQNGAAKLGGILIEKKSQQGAIENNWGNTISNYSTHFPQNEAINQNEYAIVIGIGLNWSGDPKKIVTQLQAEPKQKNQNNPYNPSKIQTSHAKPAVLFAKKKNNPNQTYPSPQSFLPYLITALNERLLAWQQGNNNFLDEVRQLFYLQNKTITYQNCQYQVKGLSDTGALILQDIQTGNVRELFCW